MKTRRLLYLCAAALMLAACDPKPQQPTSEEKENTQQDSLMRVINQRDNEINDMVSTLNDIQEGLKQINEAEGRVTVEQTNPEGDNKQAIIENIAFIQRTMQLNRELIARLRQQLKSNTAAGSKLRASMETAINNLQTQLAEKDKQIEELKKELEQKNIHIAEQTQQINTLNQNVNDLNAQNEEKARDIAARDKEMNTAWYVFGTKKELKNQKILQNGDVLRSNQFNKDYFTRVDIRVDKIIKLYSKSARLLTTHPAGSYSLDKDSKGQYTLRITNPQQFWSVSRYLVIMVK